jgi:hypothetical protein
MRAARCRQLSRRIRDRIRNTGGLLIFDEAQHLLERSIEEIRSWHDDTGVGVAFFGNETVLARIEGGHRRAAFAQLYSRIGMRLIQNLPLADDARALADAWEVHDDKQVEFLVKKSQQPGGLRTVTMMLELATMVAASERRRASSLTFRTRGRSSSRGRWRVRDEHARHSAARTRPRRSPRPGEWRARRAADSAGPGATLLAIVLAMGPGR